MDSQIVSIEDLKEYDDKIKPYIADKTVLIGSGGSISKPKITIVSSFPTSVDINTIYIIPNGSPINISTLPKENIRIGSTPISNVYVGSIKIW